MRLVDADKARECFGGDGVTGAVMQRMFDSLPTIDAVPVVRCRECKYWRRYTRQWENHCAGECERHRMEGGTYENDFCSYGQRKEDEHEQ
ncbi:Uncharacterised protein [uncultured Oscillibacter sp.]|uniref:hypothetical protein n=1 Tax=uncultured Oscillibacter sp. TaxID=876091 RepID=UPI000822719D|nr:hypothetical protein [uncultured Oscillibacter sp.]SCI19806.1 Uncharacterised protein [uncultured Oscillibacter sp.]